MSMLAQAASVVERSQPMLVQGVVAEVRGLTVLVRDLPSAVGAIVRVESDHGSCMGEIVGFGKQHAIVMLLGQSMGIRPGSPVVVVQASPVARVGEGQLGRVINGLGEPIDDLGPVRGLTVRELSPGPLSPLKRARIRKQLLTGVRVVDLMTPMGKGQRLGLFAGPGVGKSTLMGTIAQRTSAQVNVIALIGERGREVKDFVEHALGPTGLARSVVVVATGDESPLMRIHAAKLACACAEHFRERGLDVLLMMDSITRFAHAQRQVGLAAGEMPATKGYTPSVFAQMALLLERAGVLEATSAKAKGEGAVQGGSITGLYTILVEGDDMTEPVADAARGILDGHVILSRKLAQKGHFPAVDVLDSVSRVADDVASKDHMEARRKVLRMLAVYKEVEELVQIGAYAKGSNPEADTAIELIGSAHELLRQGSESQEFGAALERLKKLAVAAEKRKK
jgi:flagellum-specific ATP synthase